MRSPFRSCIFGSWVVAFGSTRRFRRGNVGQYIVNPFSLQGCHPTSQKDCLFEASKTCPNSPPVLPIFFCFANKSTSQLKFKTPWSWLKTISFPIFWKTSAPYPSWKLRYPLENPVFGRWFPFQMVPFLGTFVHFRGSWAVLRNTAKLGLSPLPVTVANEGL